ncbi:MAG: hypothetical protein ACK43N_18125, partial [Pirellulaceae bacterium]
LKLSVPLFRNFRVNRLTPKLFAAVPDVRNIEPREAPDAKATASEPFSVAERLLVDKTAADADVGQQIRLTKAAKANRMIMVPPIGRRFIDFENVIT